MTAAAVSQHVEGAARSRQRGRTHGLDRSPFQSVLAFTGASFLWMQLSLVGITAICSVAVANRPVMITGGSMRPSISRGDVVIIADVDPAALEANQLVMFDIGEGHVTHRVVGFTEEGDILTKGDANAITDTTPVPPESVIGRVRVVVPDVGLPLIWWQDRAWRPLSMWAGLTALAIFAVISRPKRSEQSTDLVELPVEPVASLAARTIPAGPFVAPILVRPVISAAPTPPTDAVLDGSSAQVEAPQTDPADRPPSRSARPTHQRTSIRTIRGVRARQHFTPIAARSVPPSQTLPTLGRRTPASPVAQPSPPGERQGSRVTRPTPRLGAPANLDVAPPRGAQPTPRIGAPATPPVRLSPTATPPSGSTCRPPATDSPRISHPLFKPPAASSIDSPQAGRTQQQPAAYDRKD